MNKKLISSGKLTQNYTKRDDIVEPNIVSVLFQAGMVGAFIFFALEINKRHAGERTLRDEQWQGFLEEERKQRTNGMNQSLKGLEKVVDAMDTNNVLAVQRTEAILEEIRRLGK